MKIPKDMHKWQVKFAWQMIGYAALLFFMSGVLIWQTWFYRDKVIADPVKLLGGAIISLLAAVAAFCAAIMCVNVSFSTRRHSTKMKELERNRPPLTLKGLREELRPEKQEQSRAKIVNLLRNSPLNTKLTSEGVAAGMAALMERYRAELGSSPEVEAEMARLRAFNESLVEELKANLEKANLEAPRH